MYNWNDDGTCPEENWGSPNVTYCSQPYVSVCLALSQLLANNDSAYGFQTGSGQIDGLGADCYAVGNNGENVPTLYYNVCLQAFTSLVARAVNVNDPGFIAAYFP